MAVSTSTGTDIEMKSQNLGTVSGKVDALSRASSTSSLGSTDVSFKKTPRASRTSLVRELGLVHATSMVVGTVIGAGIWVSPTGVTKAVGSVGLSLILWVVCGFINILSALTYLELGAMLPSAGGEYQFVSEAMGTKVAFLIVWANIFIRPASNSVIARTTGQYLLAQFFPECSTPTAVVTVFAIWLWLTILTIAARSTRLAAQINSTLSFTKFIGLIIVIAFGIVAISQGRFENLKPENAFKGSDPSPGAIAQAVYAGFYAVGGWEAVFLMQEEVKDPAKTLTRAIWLGMSSVVVVYLMVNISYFTVLTPQELLDSGAVAVDFGVKTMGSWVWIIPLFVAMSTTGALNGLLLSTSRVLFGGARERNLPSIFGMLHQDYNTPIPSIILLGGLGIIYCFLSNVNVMLQYIGFLSRMRTILTLTSFLILRWKRPDWERPIKANIVLSVINYIIILALTVFGFTKDPVTNAVGAGVFLLGVPVYFFGKWVDNNPGKISAGMDWVTARIQMLFSLVPEELEKVE